MPFLTSLSDDAKLAELFRLRPGYYSPLLRFLQQVMRGESELTAGEREMIAAYVSSLNGCDYCEGGHRAAAIALGVDEQAFDSLRGGIPGARVSEKLKPALAFVYKLTRAPREVSWLDAEAVLAAGWSETTLSDVVHVCALFNLFNRLVEGHGIVGIPEQYHTRGALHAREGYVGQYRDAD